MQTSSSTVTTALTQRAKLLQEENDELYEMLKTGETGRLKEEVRGLRRAVGRLETALRGASLELFVFFGARVGNSSDRRVPFISYLPESHHVIRTISSVLTLSTCLIATDFLRLYL